MEAFESYCYISDTFTLPRQEMMDTVNPVKPDPEVYPGVGPIGVNSRHEKIYHNYYMWIPYLLFIQSLTFYIPLFLHNFFQVGQTFFRMRCCPGLVVMGDTSCLRDCWFKSQHRILDGLDIFSHWFVCKNCIVGLNRPKIN